MLTIPIIKKLVEYRYRKIHAQMVNSSLPNFLSFDIFHFLQLRKFLTN